MKLNESDNVVEVSHDGYKKMGVYHTRKFSSENNKIIIVDSFSKQAPENQVAYFHLHPSILIITIENLKVLIGDKNIELSFKGKNVSIEKEHYRFAEGFNKTKESFKLKVLFESRLETTIQL